MYHIPFSGALPFIRPLPALFGLVLGAYMAIRLRARSNQPRRLQDLIALSELTVRTSNQLNSEMQWLVGEIKRLSPEDKMILSEQTSK